METSDSHFIRHRALYEEALRQVVCRHCIDAGDNELCRTKDPQGCAIFRYLQDLVHVAGTLHEKKIEPYVKEVRRHLCIRCKNSQQDGEKCSLRDCLDCGLDRYLPLVLEAIESVQSKLDAGTAG